MKSIPEQMDLFEDGGLKDDGMNRDPVSGNEIPTGSMAKEVRDDLPAMLSEGEYVVPSDVVRYYGVGHFEKLRNQAKQGLQKMEEDGRIGGEPIKANRGTLATGQNPSSLTRGTVVDPSPLQRPGSPYTGEFSFERPGAGSFDFDPSTPPPEVELPSPENCAKKGKVFDPILQVCVDPVIQTPASRRDDSDSDPTPVEPPTPWYETVNWTNPGETMENYFNQPSLPGLIGATVGSVGKTGYLSQARAMVQIYRATGQFTKAQQVQDVIDTQLRESRALGTTDKIIDSIFGSDGDKRTIQALRAAGIDVPNNLRLGRLGEEDELDDLLRNLNQTDKNRLRRMYGGQEEPTIPTVTPDPEPEERPQRTFVDVDPDTGQQTSVTSPTPRDSSPSVTPIKNLLYPSGDRDIRQEQRGSVNVGGPGFRGNTNRSPQQEQQDAREASRRAAERLGLDPNVRRGGRARGGLMQRKKQ